MDEKLIGVEKSLKEYIKDLKNNKIEDFYVIPEEYRNNKEIVDIERKLGIRKSDKRGHDVIQGTFFVDEIILTENYMHELVEKYITNSFDDFESYYKFLDGDIYDNACYYQYNFSKEIISKYNLKEDKLNMKSMTTEAINDILPEPSESEKEQYAETERQMMWRKKWRDKFNACLTYDELVDVYHKHMNSRDTTDALFYLWNYICYHGEKSYEVIMKFVSYGNYHAYKLRNALCFVFGPERALSAYDYNGGSASTNKQYNETYKKTVSDIINKGVSLKTIKYFDKYTHYYVERTKIYLKDNSDNKSIATLYKYFETFEEFVDYLENDISDCDISGALFLKADFSKYKLNDNTKLPISTYTNLKKVVYKNYNRKRKQFEVSIKWYNSRDIEVFNRMANFRFFFDFVAFLNNDLSDADLLFCDGLSNMLDFSNLNFKNARLRSCIFERVGVICEKYSILNNKGKKFAISEKNEKETSLVLQEDRPILYKCEKETDDKRIFYITDLHLMHRIQHANCVTKDDCIYVVQSIVDRFFINNAYGNSIILIGGDVSSDFSILKLFVELLRETINERRRNIKVIFTLGNHELWEFQDETIENIVQKYRNLLSDYDMYLLHNEIIYTDDNDNISYITSKEINNLADNDIKEKLRTARIILFGGIGFSGYNEEFNANDGVYRTTLSRTQEIEETNIFEKIYDRICSCLPDRNIIVLTHMPFEDWHFDNGKHNNYVYVSGHNHRNMFYDDGVIRIYSDNQVGYYSENPRLKYFYVDDKYDWFFDYEDGIYQITRDDYIEFYRGKNLQVTYNRNINELYMLKKNDSYCFIHKNTSGGLTILNGGSLKTLKSNDIEYYYDNMEAQIAFIKTPLGKFQSIQNQISDSIKYIGGSGYIHGAIVDIDYYNHIYVNPYDLTITPYFAWNMVEKYVYPSIPALLKVECPLLYKKYNKALTLEGNSVLAIKGEHNVKLAAKPKLYTSTDIYAASRELKKMQKLQSNILSIWYDNIPGIMELPQKQKIVKTAIGETRMMKCGMEATIVSYFNYDDVSVQFEDGTLIEHISKRKFAEGSIKNPNILINRGEKSKKRAVNSKLTYVGRTNTMKCGMKATVIEDLGYKDITVQFEDGLVRRHRRRDHFDLGKIAHVQDT